MATYLDDILHHHRTRAAADQRDWRERAAEVHAPIPSLLAVLSDSANGYVKVIAEVKRRSPSKGWLHEGLDVARIAREYHDGGASAVSVLTDAEHFAGASAVLLIVAALSDDELETFIGLAHEVGLDAVVEVHDHDEAKRSLDLGARIIGVNQRSLHTFDVDPDNAARVIQSLPTSILTICESGLSSRADVARAADAGFDAVLVGEAFVTAPDVVESVRDFATVPGVSRD
jgi:indole-3-glycerol phosphate synthase